MKLVFCFLASAVIFSSTSFAKSNALLSADAQSLLRSTFQSRAAEGSDLITLSGVTGDGKKCNLSVSGMNGASSSDDSVLMLTLKMDADEANPSGTEVMFNLDHRSQPELLNHTSSQILMKQSDVHSNLEMKEFDLGQFRHVYGQEEDSTVKDLLLLNNTDGKLSVSIANDKTQANCNLD